MKKENTCITKGLFVYTFNEEHKALFKSYVPDKF